MSPCVIKKGEDRRKKKEEVLHLFRCYTHTHPAGAGSTLKGKRKKKADTHDGQKAKTAQGGKGMNGGSPAAPVVPFEPLRTAFLPE